VAGCCEYGDEPSGSGATELVSWLVRYVHRWMDRLMDRRTDGRINIMELPLKFIRLKTC
jgi:hypothetical protein